MDGQGKNGSKERTDAKDGRTKQKEREGWTDGTKIINDGASILERMDRVDLIRRTGGRMKENPDCAKGTSRRERGGGAAAHGTTNSNVSPSLFFTITQA